MKVCLLNGLFESFDFKVDEEQDRLIRQFNRKVKKIKEAHREKVIESVEKHVKSKERETRQVSCRLIEPDIEEGLESSSALILPLLNSQIEKQRAVSVQPKRGQNPSRAPSPMRKWLEEERLSIQKPESFRIKKEDLRTIEKIGRLEPRKIMNVIREAQLKGETRVSLESLANQVNFQKKSIASIEAAMEKHPNFIEMEEKLENQLAIDLLRTKEKLEEMEFPLPPTTPGVQNQKNLKNKPKPKLAKPKFTLMKAKYLLPLPKKR